METALNLDRLAGALGEHDALPSPEELQGLMASVEVGLFIQRPEIEPSLLTTAWYLHGVASSSEAADLYAPDRRRRAFQVSAHLFDLAMADSRRTTVERMRLSFAAQVGYRRTGLEPNAMAMFNRMRKDIERAAPLTERLQSVALEVGIALLGSDSRFLFPYLRSLRRQFASLRQQVGLATLRGSLFEPSWAVVEGADSLLRYLALGNDQGLESARRFFAQPDNPDSAMSDIDARWVSAHLASIADSADTTSVWATFPPTVPDAAKRALTLTAPPVLSLWRPQVELLEGDGAANPLTPEAKRVVLSVPTSAGKTLMAQMIMVSHLATKGTSVCFVAPMKSLGREVRSAMWGRLAVLRQELGRDLPDHWDLDLDEEELADVGVDVMTPERLMHLVRRDPDAVLAKYAVFIFDEAHMLADRGRGPLLENLLAFLHWKTSQTDHRLILLSAAIGNRGEVMSWMDPAGDGTPFYSEWRGPRRLHAVYTTRKGELIRTEDVNTPSEYKVRKVFDLTGVIRLRPAAEAEVVRLAFTSPVGQLAQRHTPGGTRQPGGSESGHTTPGYETAAHIAYAVGLAGPALVVMSSRVMARQMARAIAALADPAAGTRQLTQMVKDRLGPRHPLVEVLPHGVAFHHGGLPADVLEALEGALRDGTVGWMVATSTLTEGVNLPVRTVVIAETRYEGQPADAQLRGARLVNAMGRAGRATKESEGWIVLCRQAPERATDFDLLAPDDEQLEVRSRLTNEEVLQELADFEERLRVGVDAIFQEAGEDVRGFIAYVWFVLAAEEELGNTGDDARVEAALASTLGFLQADEPTRSRWRAVAGAVRQTYEATDVTPRRRWSRAGTSISSAKTLDALATTVVEKVASTPTGIRLTEPGPALDLLRQADILDIVLALPEAPRPWGFKPYLSAGEARAIEVDPFEVLTAWIRGDDPSEMADRFLADVNAVDYRIEQMVDATTEHLEHYLSWILGVLVGVVNNMLSDRNVDRELCPDLPLYVRFGVNTSAGTELALGGVRSRRLIHEISRQYRGDQAAGTEPVRVWLSAMSIEIWRDRFSASGPELLDLLEFTRTRRGTLLPDFLETGQADAAVEPTGDETVDDDLEVRIVPLPGDPAPARLGVWDEEEELLAIVPPASHAAVEAILSTGLAFEAYLRGDRLRIVQGELLEQQDE